MIALIRAGNAVLGRVAPDAAAGVARRLFFAPRRHAPRAWERVAEQSGERVTLAGNLRALRWGRPGDPLVLLLHGWEGRATQWARFVGPLLAAGKQVVALDGPAHGTSPGREAHVLEFARAVLDRWPAEEAERAAEARRTARKWPVSSKAHAPR